MAMGFGVVVLVALLLILSSIKVLNEYERGVVFRLGRLMPERGPGIIFIIPVLERWVRIDLRVNTIEIAAQDVITRDNISAKLSGGLYFLWIHAARAFTPVSDYPV